MQKIRKALQVVLIILLSGVVMVMLLTSRILQSTTNNRNLQYIPKNAVFAARLNTGQIFRQTLSAVVESGDEEMIGELKKLTPEREKEEQTGIDYASTIYYFVVPYKGELIEGTLYNLSDRKRFEAYYAAKVEVTVFASTSDVGVLLQFPENFNNRDLLMDLASDIMEEPSNINETISFGPRDRSMISTWTDKKAEKGMQFSNAINLFMENNTFRMEGEMFIDSKSYADLSTSFKPNGFHLSSAIIPRDLNDTIQHFLEQNELYELPDIISVSFNYRGLSINEGDRLRVIPDFELLLLFADSINIDSLSSSFTRSGVINELGNRHYSHRDIEFFAQPYKGDGLILSSTTESPPMQHQKGILTAQGQLSPLFVIGGNSFYAKFLQIVPIYSSSKQLASSIERVEVEITPLDKAHCKIDGKLIFKDKTEPLLEIVKFLNRSALLK